MLLDRVVETTTVTGTGTMSLAGAAIIGGVTMRKFVTIAGSGATVAYLIDDTAGNWEFGLGVITSGSPDTLTRATVLRSSNSDGPVSFTAGTKYVYGDVNSDLIRFGPRGLPTLGGTANARTMTTAPTLKALVAGFMFCALNGAADNTSTTPTLAIDSISAKTVVRPDGSALLIGDMKASALLVFFWDGTNMRLLNPQAPGADGTWTDLASASTADLSTVAAINVRITGTTTITALGTAPSGTYKRLRFAGALTFTHNATSLILPGAANITTAADDCADVVSLGSGNWICTGYKRADGTAVAGTVVQRAYAEYANNADLATALPVDDTIPQNTEGVQVLSVSITPKTTTNRVRVRVIVWGSLTTAPANLGAALFRNSTANALRAAATTIDVAGYVRPVVIEYEDSPGSTSSQTYNVRVGAHTSAGPARLNGYAGGRYFGGVAGATIVVEEIAA